MHHTDSFSVLLYGHPWRWYCNIIKIRYVCNLRSLWPVAWTGRWPWDGLLYAKSVPHPRREDVFVVFLMLRSCSSGCRSRLCVIWLWFVVVVSSSSPYRRQNDRILSGSTTYRIVETYGRVYAPRTLPRAQRGRAIDLVAGPSRMIDGVTMPNQISGTFVHRC